MNGSLAKITIFHPRYVTQQLQPFPNTFFWYVCPLHLEAAHPPGSREGVLGHSPGSCGPSLLLEQGSIPRGMFPVPELASRWAKPPASPSAPGMSCPRRIKRVDIARAWRFMTTRCAYEPLPLLLAVPPITRAVTDPQHGVVATCRL